MIRRVGSSLALWTAILSIVILWEGHGAIWLVAGFAVLSQYELYALLEKMGHPVSRGLGLAMGFLLAPAAFYGAGWNLSLGDVMMVAVMLLALVVVLRSNHARGIERLGATLLGLLLVPFTLAYVGQLILLGGLTLAFWAIAVAKCADAGGLLVGKTLGRHQMAPRLSPKKTWEGAVGGVAFGTLAGWLVAWLGNHFADNGMLLSLGLPHLLLASLAVSVASIFSDLLQSGLKREAGVKDSGRVIPGIGGAFDLTDSVILAAPVAYAWFRVVGLTGF